MLTLIHNIAELVVVPPGPVEGARMGAPQRVRQAAVQISGDHIAWFGPAADAPLFQADVVMDARGGTVVPGLVDWPRFKFPRSGCGRRANWIGRSSFLPAIG